MNLIRWFAAAVAVAVLAGCSSGGAPTVENPVTQAPPVIDYIGPAAANADVQAFRIKLWENIKGNNRCGSCHNAGGQTPMFARNDDVNLAYQAANTVVNLQQPDQSRMVTKVASGHNCWLQSAFCLRRHAHRVDPQLGGRDRHRRHADPAAGSRPSMKSAAARASRATSGCLRQLHRCMRWCATTATANCVRCHSSSAATQQQPFFADADVDRRLRGDQVEDQSRQPDASRAWSSACATSSTTAGATRAARPTRRPCSMRSRPSRTAFRSRNVDPLAAHLQGPDACMTARWPPAATATKRRPSRSTSSRPAWATSPTTPAVIEPALNLTLSGDVTWVGGWGINVKMGGKAQGTAAASKKLSDLIKSTGEFSIEAWANNANVAQEDAFIVSYSAGTNARNFTLAQNMYQYQAYTRSDRDGRQRQPGAAHARGRHGRAGGAAARRA